MNKNSVIKKKNTTKTLIIIFAVLVMINLVGFLFLLKDKDNNGDINNDISNQSKIEEVSNFEIETKYCKLYFPEIWEGKIEVKFSDDFGYKAEFYSLVEGKESKHIFDICFNSDDGFLLGYLEIEDDVVNISVDITELKFDDSWKQEEIDNVYAMQEEINYVMDTLNKNANYVEPK